MSGNSFFLVHWNEEEARELATPLRSDGCHVLVESEDDTRVAARVREAKPDAVMIFLTRLPSHGRRAAASLKKDAKTRDIPIVFIAGKDWSVEQTRKEFPDAHFIGPEQICATLQGITGLDEC